MALLQINWKPTPPKLRTFGLVGALACLALAAVVHRRHALLGVHIEQSGSASVALACAAAIFGVLALVRPTMLRPIYVALTALTLPFGIVVSNVLLVAFYYLGIVPFGLLLRAFGWDPMHRRFERGTSSYWVPRQRPRDVSRYFKQY